MANNKQVVFSEDFIRGHLKFIISLIRNIESISTSHSNEEKFKEGLINDVISYRSKYITDSVNKIVKDSISKNKEDSDYDDVIEIDMDYSNAKDEIVNKPLSLGREKEIVNDLISKNKNPKEIEKLKKRKEFLNQVSKGYSDDTYLYEIELDKHLEILGKNGVLHKDGNNKASGKNNRKLTEESVEKILERFPHEPNRKIAKDFGVSKSTISDIGNFKTWTNITLGSESRSKDDMD